MTIASDLAPEIWNGIADAIDESRANREIVFGKVVKRDEANKLIWLQEYGGLAIPLAALTFGFAYYDTDQNGAVTKKEDRTGTNDSFHTKIIVPRIGQMAVILDPGGQHRFPICVGVIQSTNYWQGEG